MDKSYNRTVNRIDVIKNNAIAGLFGKQKFDGFQLENIDFENIKDNINEIIGAYEALQVEQENVGKEIDAIAKKGDSATEDDLKQAEALEKYNTSLSETAAEAQQYMNDYASAISETYTAYKNAKELGVATPEQLAQLSEMESVITEITKIATGAKSVETEIGNIFAKASFIGVKDELVEAGNVSREVLDGVITSTPGLTAALDDAGVSAQELADYIMAIADPDALRFDEVKKQLADDFIPDIQEVGAHAKKAREAIWNEFSSDHTQEEIEILYKYVNENDLDISDWTSEDLEYNLELAVNPSSVEEVAQTFASLLSGEGMSNQIDEFQSNVSSIQSVLQSLDAGEEINLADITQQFPELIGQTDNLQESLSNLQLEKLDEFTESWESMTEGLSGEELANANEYFSNLINSLDFSSMDMSALRNKINEFLWSNISGGDSVKRAQEITDEFSSELQSGDNLDILFKLLADPANAETEIESLRAEYENLTFEATFTVRQEGFENIKQLQAAMSEQASSGRVSAASVKSLVETNEAYASVLVDTASGMMIDTQRANELAKAQSDLELAMIETEKSAAKMQFQQNEQEMLRLAGSAENLQRILSDTANMSAYSEIFNLASENAGLQSQIQQWQALSSEIRGAMSLLGQYESAQSSANASDNYGKVVSGKETADKLYEQGWTTKDDFTSYAMLLAENGATLEEAVLNYEENSKRFERYLTEDSSGLHNFVDDALAKSQELGNEFVALGENGEKIFNIDDMNAFADSMGMNTQMAENMLLALNDAGYNIDLSMIGDSFRESLSTIDLTANNAGQQVQNVITRMGELASAGVDVSESVQPIAESLQALSENGVDVSGMVEQLNEIGELNGFEIDPQTLEVEVKQTGKTPAEIAAEAEGQTATMDVEVNEVEGEKVPIEENAEKTVVVNETPGQQLEETQETTTATVNYEKGEQQPPELEEAVVDYTLGHQALPQVKTTTVNYALGYQEQPSPVTVKVNYDTSGAPKTAGALGTAHAYGTVMDMWNGYRASIGAYAQGNNWALSRNESALVNEIGIIMPLYLYRKSI